jgi:hypothetical protein
LIATAETRFSKTWTRGAAFCVEEEGSDDLLGSFDTAEEAISYTLMDFKGQELNLNIKSLEWYHAQEEVSA